LVPIGARAGTPKPVQAEDDQEAATDVRREPVLRSIPEAPPDAPPSAADFWGERADAIQDAIEVTSGPDGNGAVETRRRGARRERTHLTWIFRRPLVIGSLALLVVAGVVLGLLSTAGPVGSRHTSTQAARRATTTARPPLPAIVTPARTSRRARPAHHRSARPQHARRPARATSPPAVASVVPASRSASQAGTTTTSPNSSSSQPSMRQSTVSHESVSDGVGGGSTSGTTQPSGGSAPDSHSVSGASASHSPSSASPTGASGALGPIGSPNG
jgi:hypothetical protein